MAWAKAYGHKLAQGYCAAGLKPKAMAMAHGPKLGHGPRLRQRSLRLLLIMLLTLLTLLTYLRVKRCEPRVKGQLPARRLPPRAPPDI